MREGLINLLYTQKVLCNHYVILGKGFNNRESLLLL